MHLQLFPLWWNCCALLEDAIITAPSRLIPFSHPATATFAVAHRAVVSEAVAEVGAFSAMIVELATVERELPVAEASDEVAAATLLILISALDGSRFSSIFIFIAAIFNLMEGFPDGAGELLATTVAAAL